MKLTINSPSDFKGSLEGLLYLRFARQLEIDPVQLRFVGNTATIELPMETLKLIQGGTVSISSYDEKVLVASFNCPIPGITPADRMDRVLTLPLATLKTIVPPTPVIVVAPKEEAKTGTPAANSTGSANTPSTDKGAPKKGSPAPKEEEAEEEDEKSSGEAAMLLTADDHKKALEAEASREKEAKEKATRIKNAWTFGALVAVVFIVGVFIYFLKDSPVRDEASQTALFSFDLLTAYAQGGSIPLFTQVLLVITGASILIALTDRGITHQFADFWAAIIAYVFYILASLQEKYQQGYLASGFFLMYYLAGTNGVDLTSPGMFWLLNASTLVVFLFGGVILEALFPNGNVVVMGLWSLFKKGGPAGVSYIPSVLVLIFLVVAAVHFFLDAKGFFVKGKAPGASKNAFAFSYIFVAAFLLLVLFTSIAKATSTTFILLLVIMMLLLYFAALLPFFFNTTMFSPEAGIFTKVSDGKAVTLAQLDGLLQGGTWVVIVLFLIS